ncbi:MAG: carbohydrate kinase family protein [Candidatus Hodarchaeales archaeon]|jgi:fructokinase
MDITNRVFCLGHISVDIFINRLNLDDLRIGGCINSQDLGIYGGGDTANVSFWLGKLGVPISLIGVIANDPAGNFVKTELEKANVTCELKYSKEHPTASILIIVEPDGERSFIINGASQDELEWDDIPLKDILNGRLFYTSAYTIENPPIKNVIKRVFKQIKTDSSTSTLTMFNLAAFTTVEKYKTEIKSKILPYTDILVGNIDEYNILTFNNKDPSQSDFFSIGKKIMKNFTNIEVVLVTGGRKGCYYITKEHQGHIPAPKVPVVDTTGAGDGFCAGFISGYFSSGNVNDAVKLGTTLGSHICKGYGARFGASSFSKQ